MLFDIILKFYVNCNYFLFMSLSVHNLINVITQIIYEK